MDDGYYDVAQICENGHVANSMGHNYPNSNQDHCDKCGAPTIHGLSFLSDRDP